VRELFQFNAITYNCRKNH